MGRIGKLVKRSSASAAAVAAAAVLAWGQTKLPALWPLADPGAVTTHQSLTPAGVSAVLNGQVNGVTFGTEGDVWTMAGGTLYRLTLRDNQARAVAGVGLRGGFQGVSRDAATGGVLVTAALNVTGSNGKPESVALMRVSPAGVVQTVARELGNRTAGNAAAGGGWAVVPLPADNSVAVVDLAQGRVTARLKTGNAPFGAAMSPDGTAAWVSHWGGRFAWKGETTGPTGVLVDSRGIASSGTVARIDMATFTVTDEIETGAHPTAMEWDTSRGRLYVANSNGDGVTVVDTETRMAAAQWPIHAGGGETGVTPSALALTADGQRLYVACAGLNAVAVLETEGGRVLGMIPTGWYPTSLALSVDGKHLAVGSLLGAGTGAADAKRKSIWQKRGMVSVVAVPEAQELADYTEAVRANNRVDVRGGVETAGCTAGEVVPRCGEAGPIEYVVFIIKENRTYDQVLGDLWHGNGDPSLVMYPGHITPNHHRLAEQFVTLDNFYATGGVSAEGHNWLTQAFAPSYVQWPGYHGRSYPFDGTDPLAYSPKGFLWDLARSRGKSVRVYGEMAPSIAERSGDRARFLREWALGGDFTGRWNVKAQLPTLNEVLAPYYPSYTLGVPDVVRARIFLKDLAGWSESGWMPNLVMLQLPSDHTMGTTPGESTPYAMVADNDLALGQIVEGLTKSPFWPKMAIFVVEDDAQDGVDHVDGHRTVALMVSPYSKRGAVDSTFYSHQSILKTIEMILGLPTMTMFDLIATDMRASFTDTPDLTPYEPEMPQVSLFDVNPPLSALGGQARRDAVASRRMDWREPDDVPAEALNRILWRAARGGQYPGTRVGALRPGVGESALTGLRR